MATSSTLKIKLLKDTGTSTSDLITANGQTTISGYKPADLLSCRWSSDGGLTWSAWASTSATLAPPASDGSWTVQVQETTTAGKLVATASLAFVLDT